MQRHLIHLFRYNDWANRRILDAMAALEDDGEARHLFSHLVYSQRRWLGRIVDSADKDLPWFGPAMALEACLPAWERSVGDWIDFLQQHGDRLPETFTYPSSDGDGIYTSVVRDVALQLNLHSVHHRAQIARMIRQHGQAPPPTDYIYYARNTG